MGVSKIPEEYLASLPKERRAVSYMIAIDKSGRMVVVKFRFWKAGTEVVHLSPPLAVHIRDSLRDSLLQKKIPDLRKSPKESVIVSFYKKIPTLEANDWNSTPPEGTRQASGCEVLCYDDAIFLAFLMNPKKLIYRVLRLDPRICFDLVDIISEAEPRLHNLDLMTPPSHQKH